MILSDTTIAEYIRDGTIEVDPGVTPEQIQPASLDVRLGPQFYDLWHNEHFSHEPGETLSLKPGARILGHTESVFHLPDFLAAQVSGRSTLGRMFVTVHQTAGWCDPGYDGDITLEIANFSHDIRPLEVGQRIGQLVFFRLDEPSDGYDGQYQGSRGPVPAGDL